MASMGLKRWTPLPGRGHTSGSLNQILGRRAGEAELCAQQWGWPRGTALQETPTPTLTVASHYRAGCPLENCSKLLPQGARSFVLHITTSVDLPKCSLRRRLDRRSGFTQTAGVNKQARKLRFTAATPDP